VKYCIHRLGGKGPFNRPLKSAVVVKHFNFLRLMSALKCRRLTNQEGDPVARARDKKIGQFPSQVVPWKKLVRRRTLSRDS